jgi:pyruvate formate lyase activating enzyme
MKIAAIQKFSMLDYPNKLSAVVFCQGCGMRCKYCHNPDFLDVSKPVALEFSELSQLLENRKDKLEAVVFSGGEPLLQPDLYEAMTKVKSMGFLIGLHTAGMEPSRFSEVLPIVNWVGFDIKTSFENYENITQVKNSGKFAKESFEKLLASNADYEIRTTYDPRNTTAEDMINVAKTLQIHGVADWIIQECILRNNKLKERLYLPNSDIISEISKYVNIEFRQE